MSRRLAFRIVWIGAVGILLVAAPEDPYAVNPSKGFAAPSWDHWAGTDRLGRDVLSRTSCALRLTLIHVMLAECVSVPAALLFAGFVVGLGFKAPHDTRVVGTLTLSLRMVPPFLFALTIAVLLRGSSYAVILALAVISFSYAAPVFEGELNSLRRLPQREGAIILGAPWTWQLRKYLIPIAGPRLRRYIILDAMSLAAFEALFGFFGLTEPEAPSLGGMIAQARFYILDSPWLLAAPALALALLLAGAWQASVSTEWR